MRSPYISRPTSTRASFISHAPTSSPGSTEPSACGASVAAHQQRYQCDRGGKGPVDAAERGENARRHGPQIDQHPAQRVRIVVLDDRAEKKERSEEPVEDARHGASYLPCFRDLPFARRASSMSPIAFGPMPCSALSSSSVKRMTWYRLDTPTEASARIAGLATPWGIRTLAASSSGTHGHAFDGDLVTMTPTRKAMAARAGPNTNAPVIAASISRSCWY